jgi:hypothetical protein
MFLVRKTSLTAPDWFKGLREPSVHDWTSHPSKTDLSQFYIDRTPRLRQPVGLQSVEGPRRALVVICWKRETQSLHVFTQTSPPLRPNRAPGDRASANEPVKSAF